jgi:RNA polymerase subunit RPABC4/transcription elongation factor Spt4
LALAVLQTDTDPFQVINDILNSNILSTALQLVGLFFLVLWLALVYWTFADAMRRGATSWFWGAIALLLPFLGTLIYLIVRPPEYALDARERDLELAVLEREVRQTNLCPNCNSLVEKDYLLCPECGWELKKQCENCSRPLQLKWGTCPYCGEDQKGSRRLDWQAED